MKKAYKVISVLTIVLILVCICTNIFAITTSVDISGIESAADSASTTEADTAMKTIGGTIIKYVTNAAIVVSVVMIAILGIKYMMGSAEEKSEYKKSMVPLLVGAILVFGAATIAKIIVNLASAF